MTEQCLINILSEGGFHKSDKSNSTSESNLSMIAYNGTDAYQFYLSMFTIFEPELVVIKIGPEIIKRNVEFDWSKEDQFKFMLSKDLLDKYRTLYDAMTNFSKEIL